MAESRGLSDDMVRTDIQYIRDRSIWTDLSILANAFGCDRRPHSLLRLFGSGLAIVRGDYSYR